jgi:hypothetical protein
MVTVLCAREDADDPNKVKSSFKPVVTSLLPLKNAIIYYLACVGIPIAAQRGGMEIDELSGHET